MDNVATVVDRTVRLSVDRTHRLRELASSWGTTEDALIERALDLLFATSGGDLGEEQRAWNRLGSESLAHIWDNDADAVYDDWKSLYAIQAR